MSWPDSTRRTILRLNYIKETLSSQFVGRTEALELLVLAAVCQEHLLLIGPPGTAKTDIIQRFTSLVDASGFHYLLTRFTEPSELFGPLDLAAFKKGLFQVRTADMLPEAQITFLDEVFQGGSAILNALLTLLNERIFYNGPVRQRVPLICMIGASNSIPDDPSLQAFADRFVLRLTVDRTQDDATEELLELGWALERDKIDSAERAANNQPSGVLTAGVNVRDIIDLHFRLREVDLNPIRPEYAQLIRELRAEGVEMSDRRAVRGLKLIAGATLLRQSDVAETRDMWPVLHLWNRPEEASAVRSVVQPRLADAGGAIISSKRPVGEILDDLEALVSREQYISSEAAWGAHLMALSKLRIEAINDHPKDRDIRRLVDERIQQALTRMENVHV